MTAITAVAAGDTVSVYGEKVSDPDVEGYELRVGAAWVGGLFVAFNETPNFRLTGIKLGTFTFWCNGKDNSGNYATTPVSASVTVFYPPGYTDKNTWSWDYNGIGTHDNTEYELYSGDDCLKCSHKTEWMPNQVDRDFSGASAWANVDLNAYDETGDLTITASAADQYCTCPVLSAPTTIGLTYKMTYDCANIVSTWIVQSFDGTQTIGTISEDGTQDSLEWTAETTGGYRIVAGADDSSADFDNFTLLQTTPSNLTGTWTSPEYDLGSEKTVRVWGDFLTTFVSSTTSWAGIFPDATTWADKTDANTRWYKLTTPDVAAILNAKIKWGTSTGVYPFEADFFQILAPEFTARYVQVEIEITDPQADANLYVKKLNMKAAYWS